MNSTLIRAAWQNTVAAPGAGTREGFFLALGMTMKQRAVVSNPSAALSIDSARDLEPSEAPYPKQRLETAQTAGT